MLRWFSQIFAMAFALLAACGGTEDVIGGAGGGSGGASGGAGTLACALTGCEIAKLPPTSTMPTGSATYDGRASVTTLDTGGALRTTNADLSVSANFTARSIDVSMTNVQTAGVSYQGSLTGNGTISGNNFTSNFSGVLVDVNTGATLTTGDMTGTFRGTNAAALNGQMTILGGGAAGGDAYGQFWANRK